MSSRWPGWNFHGPTLVMKLSLFKVYYNNYFDYFMLHVLTLHMHASSICYTRAHYYSWSISLCGQLTVLICRTEKQMLNSRWMQCIFAGGSKPTWLYEECEMWCLLYSPWKLSSIAKQKFAITLDNYTFTCGASLKLKTSFFFEWSLTWNAMNLWRSCTYSMNYNLVCMYCCNEDDFVARERCYPQCEQCKHKAPVKKRV